MFTGRVIARVKHQEKRSKIEKLSENVRFAFLLRNIFEREWKCFALVCRAQTKDTHTHTLFCLHTAPETVLFCLYSAASYTNARTRPNRLARRFCESYRIWRLAASLLFE